MKDTFGLSRVLEPKGTMPVTAWKLDNSREIKTNEARIAIELIDVDVNNFLHTCYQFDFDEELMKQKFIDVIEKRGKFHNPFTDSGGVFYGKIEAMGEEYKEVTHFEVGDEYIAQATLTAIPMHLDEITSIDFNYGQLYVKGYAIVFEESMIYKRQKYGNIKTILKTLEEASNLYQASKMVEDSKKIAIIGKDIMLTVLYTGATRRAAKKGTKITLIMDHDGCGGIPEENIEKLMKRNADDVYFVDLRNSIESSKVIAEDLETFDLVINTEDRVGAETLSTFLVCEDGTVYFTNMSNGLMEFVLIAESMPRHVHAIERDQYYIGNDGFTDDLMVSMAKDIEVADEMFQNVATKRGLSENMAVVLSQYRVGKVDDFIYASNVTEAMVEEAINVANYDCNVIIQGETGVGKEKVLQLIHKNSQRSNKPCIKVNCATIQESLAESEFFGYEPGSFTGAQSTGKKGYFELANNGILFMDEIGTLSMNMQSKLLRVLQESQFYRVGGTEQLSVNVRVICANNIPLKSLVDEGRFREDLYYRLNICTINVPPLRDRKEDIYVLAKEFLSVYNKKYGVLKEIDEDGFAALNKYEWPGNVRELENTIHRMIINTKGNMITGLDAEKLLGQNAYDDYIVETKTKLGNGADVDFNHIMEQQEKKLCEYALKKHSTTRQAADSLGITQSKLMRMKQKYGL